MSNSGKSDPIVIRLEVHIPTGAGVVIQGPAPGAPDKSVAPGRGGGAQDDGRFRPLWITVCRYECRMSSSNATKVFAQGQRPLDQSFGLPKNVWGRVYNPPESYPNSPENVNGAKSVSCDQYDGSFVFKDGDLLDGGACHLPYGPRPKGVFWAEYRDSQNTAHYMTAEAPVLGDCTYLPDCASFPLWRGRCGSSRNEPLALAWAVDAAGFRGDSMGTFNGHYKLHVAEESCKGTLIDNRRSCAPDLKRPLVEIRSEANRWTLAMTHGKARVVYAIPSDKIHPNGPNAFSIAEATGVPPFDSVPAILVAQPG